MGFSLVTDGSQKANLVAGHPGDPLSSFVDAIRDGLSQRITSFSVDVGMEPQVLPLVLEPLKKLQQLLRGRGQSVILKGSGLEGQSPLAQDLHAAGIVMPDVEGLIAAPRADQPLSSTETELLSDELKILFKELDTDFGGSVVLPPADRVTPYMNAVQNRLAALLKLDEALKTERDILARRLTALKKREPGGAKNLDEYNQLMAEEQVIGKMRDEIPKLRRELMVAKDAAATQEKVFKEYTSRLDSENRKKQESLKKELQTLKDNHKKIEAEVAKQKPAPPKKDGA